MSVSENRLFWTSFADEFEKQAAKGPTTFKVPKPGTTTFGGMDRYTGNPGKTPVTSPGKASGSLATTSGLGHSAPVGRTGTSANPSPVPPPVR